MLCLDSGLEPQGAVDLPASVLPPAAGMCRPAHEGCPLSFLPARSPLQLLEFLCCSKHVLSFISPAQQDRVLQQWEERAAVQLTDTKKPQTPAMWPKRTV